MFGRSTTMEFSAPAMAKLSAIKTLSGIEDNKDIIRAALSVYGALLETVVGGNSVHVRDGANNDYPYSLFKVFSHPELRVASEPVPDDAKIQNFSFPKEALDRLAVIKQLGHLESNSNAVRAALACFDELVGIVRAGNKIIVVGKDGKEEPYVLPIVRREDTQGQRPKPLDSKLTPVN